jgi:hypothetical protein
MGHTVQWLRWMRLYAAVGSSPDEVKEFIFFNLSNPSSRTRLWGLLIRR